MKRKLLFWELAGFLWTVCAGIALHFLYRWSGANAVAAAFSGVNESTWEHMKLLFVPIFFFSVVQICCMGRLYPNFLAVRAVSALAGTVLIPVAFYTYTGIVGFHVLWADVAVFVAAAAVAFGLDLRLLSRGSLCSGWMQVAGLAALWVVMFLFVWCTFQPPHLPLWQDPLTGGYGIPPTPAG